MTIRAQNHLEELLQRLVAASGTDSLDERKRVFNYVRFTDDDLVIRQVRQIRNSRLLNQLLGVGVAGPITRAVNAQLERIGG